MKKHAEFRWLGVIPGIVLMAGGLAHGAPNAWTGLGDGTDWFDGANWSAGVPAAAQEVTVDAGSIWLTNETAALAAFTLTGGTLTFSNWTTRLRADEVDLQGGEVTLPPAFRETQMSNRVWIVCSNFTLGASATMDVVGLGYAFLNGPGAATASGTGASHGGKAGRGPSAVDVPPCYGSATGPEIPGSGGSYDSSNEPHQGAGGAPSGLKPRDGWR